MGSARRMGGVIGNPNAMGIFLVIGWFALRYFLEGQEGDEKGQGHFLLSSMEPILLAALGLTLSMGSFVAMAAGICVLIGGKTWRAGWWR